MIRILERPTTPPTDREVTPAELLANPQWERCELIEGKVVTMSPTGHRHAEIAILISASLLEFAKDSELGKVYGTDGGFLYPDGRTVRAPDVMFVARERLKDLPEDGFLPFAPDLAVEVLSPSDMLADVLAKAESYIGVGVRLVWIIDPKAGCAFVLHPGAKTERVERTGTLSGADVLPGFEMNLENILST